MPKIIPIESAKLDSITPDRWQQQLSQAITDPLQLLHLLNLDINDCAYFSKDPQEFNLKVPLAYIRKMRSADPDDPLLLQVMTQSQELMVVEGFNKDPVGDLASNKTPGLLHKYHGRVLLITTAACALHCRYCFRRHYPYSELQAGRDQWQKAINYIQQDSSIKEVILSGGDPLVLSDKRLDSLIFQLEEIKHLKRLRIHTRLPARASQVAASGVGAMASDALKPLSHRSSAMCFLKLCNPPKRRRLPAISSNRTLRSAMQTNDV